MAATKTGDPIPDFLDSPNGWGEALSELAAAAADLIQCAPFRPDTSFPFLKIAREHHVDYGRVLRYADWVEAYCFGEPGQPYRPSYNSHSPISRAVYDAILAERDRRAAVGAAA